MISANDISILNFMMSPGDKIIPTEEQTISNQTFKVIDNKLSFTTQLDIWSPTNLSGNRAIIERVSGLGSIEILSHNIIESPNYRYYLIDEKAFEVNLEHTQS